MAGKYSFISFEEMDNELLLLCSKIKKKKAAKEKWRDSSKKVNYQGLVRGVLERFQFHRTGGGKATQYIQHALL